MMITLTKYQALGNSFIVLEEIQDRGRSKKLERLAREVCDSGSGVGADGLMVISRENSQYRLDIYNADGSWAEKSGNGTRIGAMHLLNQGLVSGSEHEFVTGSGTSVVRFHRGDRYRRTISASLGQPQFDAAEIPVDCRSKYFINQSVECGGRNYIGSAVSIGNPHLVMFCNDFKFDWRLAGSLLEVDPVFPNRINVGFVVVRDEANIEVRDWERGVGPTGSSGTGAAAAVVMSVMRGFTQRRVKVHSPAGTLQIKWDDSTDALIIKGPVQFVCAGQFKYGR